MLGFSPACALALRTIAGTSAIEALPAIAGAFTFRALARAFADIAFQSMFFHVQAPPSRAIQQF
jgi:hypothetical protein